MLERARALDDLVTKLESLRRDHYEYLEVKQLAEILARQRDKTRAAIREYRDLKRAITAEADAIEKLYLGYEGMFMRDHLRDALRLYVMVNRDFHEAWRSYMDALKAENTAPADALVTFTMPQSISPISSGVTKMPQRRRKAA